MDVEQSPFGESTVSGELYEGLQEFEVQQVRVNTSDELLLIYCFHKCNSPGNDLSKV
jgi:hypothetical protein